MGVFRRKRGIEGLDLARCGEKGKRGGGGDCPKGAELDPGPPADLLAQGDAGAAEASKSRSRVTWL